MIYSENLIDKRVRGGRARRGRRGDGHHDVVVIPVYGTSGRDTSEGGTVIQGAPEPINETGGSNTTGQARGGSRNDHSRDFKSSLIGALICLFCLFMSLASVV